AAGFQLVGLRPTLGVVLTLYVVIVGLQSLLQRQQTILSAAVQQAIVTTLRDRVYRAIAGMRWLEFARALASDYEQILTVEVDRVGSAAYLMVDLVVMTVISLIYVGLAFRVSPAMTVFTLLCGGVLALTIRGKMERAHVAGEDLS